MSDTLNRLAQAMARRGPSSGLFRCKTIECIMRELNNSTMRNCSYRYSSPDTITSIALWIDGPFTCIAAILALISARYAFRFLYKAGLNKNLTAALFSLCLIDSLLMITVFLFYCIEAMGMLFFKTNLMYNQQAFTSSLHGVASSMTTSSTLLVIYITFLRCMVVVRPFKYAYLQTRRFRHSKGNSVSKSMQVESETAPLHPVRKARRTLADLKRAIRPYLLPGLAIFISFAINIPVFFEFTVEKCHDVEHDVEASCPAPTVFRNQFTRYKAVLMTITQTVGPVATILILTLITEYRIHVSLQERRKLFENQPRCKELVMAEEVKERVSRTVAIFIAVKFLIFRSMPVFFDFYENFYGIDSFGVALSVLVRVSDFMIVLNSATNSLAYFGKKKWLERSLRTLMMKKEEKRNLKIISRRQSTNSDGAGKSISSAFDHKSSVPTMV